MVVANAVAILINRTKKAPNASKSKKLKRVPLLINRTIGVNVYGSPSRISSTVSKIIANWIIKAKYRASYQRRPVSNCPINAACAVSVYVAVNARNKTDASISTWIRNLAMATIVRVAVTYARFRTSMVRIVIGRNSSVNRWSRKSKR